MRNPYVKLEKQMVRYSDLLKVRIRDCQEKMIPIVGVPTLYLKGMDDMNKFTKNTMMVRKSVLQKLLLAQKELKSIDANLSLLATYGFRDIDIQISRFTKRLREISTLYFENADRLYEEVHRYVAVPTVAGHPTGGALDIVIINSKTKKILDFGTTPYDYQSKDCYVFSPNINAVAKKNRKILRRCMTKVGFAPFDGEWWHFSYGDREWAFYYKKPDAIYGQRSLKDLKEPSND